MHAQGDSLKLYSAPWTTHDCRSHRRHTQGRCVCIDPRWSALRVRLWRCGEALRVWVRDDALRTQATKTHRSTARTHARFCPRAESRNQPHQLFLFYCEISRWGCDRVGHPIDLSLAVAQQWNWVAERDTNARRRRPGEEAVCCVCQTGGEEIIYITSILLC